MLCCYALLDENNSKLFLQIYKNKNYSEQDKIY